jgi:DNA-binding IclR family transcriptional regulator
MTAERLDEDPGGGARSVIDRAFAIIGTFQGGRVRQSLSDISRHTGLPIATCYRIVQRLNEWGALERDSEGKYRIGLRLWEVASLAPRSVGLQRIARPYLQDLYETTGYAAHLAIREGLELVSIERFQSPRQVPRRPRTGHRYPLHVTAIAQVLLAHAPEEVQEEVLSGELRATTEYTYTQREVLERVLADIRSRGYAISDRQADLVHVGVAAPIFAPDKSVVAALSLALTRDDVDEKNMIHLVRIAANGISRALRESGHASVVIYDSPST